MPRYIERRTAQNLLPVRKNIKHLNLAIYPLDGRVRVSVPYHVTDKHIRNVILSKLDWIRQKQRGFKLQAPQPERQYISGEDHFVFGKKHRLEVVQSTVRQHVVLDDAGNLKLFVKPNISYANKEKLFNEWYRSELKQRVPTLINRWQPVIGKQVDWFGIKKMKTRWGTCNINKRRIWLNLELAKRPVACLEYVVVHEMVHLLERNHSKRFYTFMDNFLPEWQTYKDILNNTALS